MVILHIKVGRHMKKILAVLLIFFCINAFGQHKKGAAHQKIKAYSPSDYPADQYSTRTEEKSLGEVKIQIIHVMSKGLTSDIECKAWLTVKKGNKVTGQMFFDDISPDFGPAGIFFPVKQPREDLVVAMKFGDYDGKIIVVDRDGNVNTMPGGDFYLSEDNQYLFSNYSSDQPGLTIIDLDKNNAVLADSAVMDNKLGQWYYQDDKFFAIAQTKDETDTTQLTIGTWDMKKKKIVFSQVEKDYPEKDSKLKFYSFYTDPKEKGNCSCGKR